MENSQIAGAARIAVLLALAGTAPGCRRDDASASAPGAAAAVPARVQTARPERRDIVRSVALAATLEPWEAAILHAKATGYVRQMRVDRGDRVSKGQLVAVLDVPEPHNEIARAQAERQQATAALEQARADERLQEVTSRRLEAVRKEERGAVSEQDLDVARGKVELARAAAGTTEARLGVLDAEIARLRTLASFSRIVTPFAGIVTDRFVDPGALVTAGSAGKPAAIAKIVNASRLRVVVDVPEIDVPHVKVGAAAELTVDALPGRGFAGQVGRRSEAVDPSSRTMRVEVEVANPDGSLAPGMFGRVRLSLDTRRAALTVSPLAIKMMKDQPYVYVARNGAAARVNLKIGADDGKVVEVVHGLAPHDEVIVASAAPLSDGSPVSVAPAPVAGK